MIKTKPLTTKLWPQLEKLFGERGACGGCWCMWWRVKRSEFNKNKGGKNKRALQNLVAKGTKPGLLAFDGKQAIAWCAVEPRGAYPVLDNSRILAPLDNRPVWSITCFFVAKPYRRKGISVELLKSVCQYVAKQGGQIVEGYPVEPRQAKAPDAFMWTGLASSFRKAGFKEVARRSATRPIMRKSLKPKS